MARIFQSAGAAAQPALFEPPAPGGAAKLFAAAIPGVPRLFGGEEAPPELGAPLTWDEIRGTWDEIPGDFDETGNQ